MSSGIPAVVVGLTALLCWSVAGWRDIVRRPREVSLLWLGPFAVWMVCFIVGVAAVASTDDPPMNSGWTFFGGLFWASTIPATQAGLLAVARWIRPTQTADERPVGPRWRLGAVAVVALCSVLDSVFLGDMSGFRGWTAFAFCLVLLALLADDAPRLHAARRASCGALILGAWMQVVALAWVFSLPSKAPTVRDEPVAIALLVGLGIAAYVVGRPRLLHLVPPAAVITGVSAWSWMLV